MTIPLILAIAIVLMALVLIIIAARQYGTPDSEDVCMCVVLVVLLGGMFILGCWHMAAPRLVLQQQRAADAGGAKGGVDAN